MCTNFYILIRAIESESETLERKFFIYEWPPELSDVYPPLSANLDEDTSYDHAFNRNGGAGKSLNSANGLFQTWQFSLYKVNLVY